MKDASTTRDTAKTAHEPGAQATAGPVVAICGGIGGAKLALGLYRLLGPDRLRVVVNTGDDFEHLGLHIAPDVDTVLYTLAGCNNPRTGWGRAEETWTFMTVLESLGGETWFRLGDGDLALHLERTRRLRAGQSPSEACDAIRRRMGIRARVLPMSDDPVRTVVHTGDGPLPFQHYFVRLACAPEVTGISFAGAEAASASRAVLASLAEPSLSAVVICPSNPYLSIDPILAVPGLRGALAVCTAPVVAVSPIVAGRALKGPTAKIMRELGLPATAKSIAEHYHGLIDGFVLDRWDAEQADELTLPVATAQTVMTSLDDRIALAREVLAFARRLGRRVPPEDHETGEHQTGAHETGGREIGEAVL